MFSRLKAKNCVISILGSAILSFGLYNIHSISDVTEGGVLGLTLLLHHWFNISPAFSGLILNLACYYMGWRVIGGEFVAYSLVSGGAFSLFYWIFEQFPPLFPAIAYMPFAASILGGIFVGVGVGLCVRQGGAPGGDDALAMSLSKLSGFGIQWLYLASDLSVLALSLTYIPFSKMLYSLLTVILSGQMIGWICRVPAKKESCLQDSINTEKTNLRA